SAGGEQLHHQGDAAEAEPIVVVQLALHPLLELLFVDEGAVARAGVFDESLTRARIALHHGVARRGARVLQRDLRLVVDAGATDDGATGPQRPELAGGLVLKSDQEADEDLTAARVADGTGTGIEAHGGRGGDARSAGDHRGRGRSAARARHRGQRWW